VLVAADGVSQDFERGIEHRLTAVIAVHRSPVAHWIKHS
jgi:hypothetical protein